MTRHPICHLDLDVIFEHDVHADMHEEPQESGGRRCHSVPEYREDLNNLILFHR